LGFFKILDKNIFQKFFFKDLYILTVGSDRGKLKIVRTNVSCPICGFLVDRERRHFAAGRLVGNAQIFNSTFTRDKSTK